MDQLESQSIVTILEAFAAFALVAGILIALADTRAYPLAFGIVVIAAVYFGIRNSGTILNFGKLVNRAGQIASGQSPPKVG